MVSNFDTPGLDMGRLKALLLRRSLADVESACAAVDNGFSGRASDLDVVDGKDRGFWRPSFEAVHG